MNTPSRQAQIIPAWSGWRSLLQAGDMIGQRWPVYLQVMLLWLAITLLLAVLPAGSLLLFLLAPLLQGGVLLLFDRQLQHGGLQPLQLFGMFAHAQRIVLLLAMLWLLLMMFAAIVLALLPFAELVQQLQTLASIEDLEQLELPPQQLFWMFSALMVVFALGSMLWFFAVPRIVLDLLPARAALLDSLRACVRNWRALLTYGMAYLMIVTAAVIMLVLVNLLPGLLLGEAAAIAVSQLTLAFFTTALQVLNVGGIYLLWRQVYPRAQGNGVPESDDETRFLA